MRYNRIATSVSLMYFSMSASYFSLRFLRSSAGYHHKPFKPSKEDMAVYKSFWIRCDTLL